MLKSTRGIAKYLVFVTTLLTATLYAATMPKPDIPAAPVPAQVLSARRIFISNGEGTGKIWPPDLIYDGFYAGMKNWGKYELASTPADADIVFEVNYVGSTYANPDERAQILMIDPKTHITLWHIVRELRGWNRPATGLKNFGEDMTDLVNDVTKLVGGAGEQK